MLKDKLNHCWLPYELDKMDSLLKDPLAFKGEKLNIKWEVKDKEAVYVPVAASVTSANGLKR